MESVAKRVPNMRYRAPVCLLLVVAFWVVCIVEKMHWLAIVAILFGCLVVVLLLAVLIPAGIYANRMDKPMTKGAGNKVQNIILNALNGYIHFTASDSKPFLDWRTWFPEGQELVDHWEEIAEEAKRVSMTAPTFDSVDKKNKGLSQHGGKEWRTFVFRYYGDYNEENCAKCPITAGLLRNIPGINLAMFSIMEPGKRLYPHEGPWKGIGRVHLGLVIPEHGQAFIKVDGEDYHWKNGEMVMFDDTYTHETDNPEGLEGSCDRIVLFIDIDRRDVGGVFHKIRDYYGKSYFQDVNKTIEERHTRRAEA